MSVTAFLIDNNWFGCTLEMDSSGKIMLDHAQASLLSKPLRFFLNEPGTCAILDEMLFAKYPLTTKFWRKFCAEEQLSESDQFFLLDFMLYFLERELPRYTDRTLFSLVMCATNNLTKSHGIVFTFFLSWLRTKTKTDYYRDYFMEQRYTCDGEKDAYSMDEYMELCYRLFNEEHIEENDMYARAAKSKNYTDTWLYLSLHFICALRDTDLTRIYHPELPYNPQETLERIRSGTFSTNDARAVLLSITTRLCVLPLVPNKTAEHSGIGSIKLVFPESCETHFGILFALAEAHRQLDGTADTPIIRRVSTYEDITRYMGDDIGELFLEANFHAKSATKSFLQSIYMMADDVLDEHNSGPSVKGYLLAAMARSHKGNYGEFANTTFEYLKDAKFSGLTPEFVAFELFERGVLSFAASSLLRIITNDDYSKLTVKQQTSLIKTLGLLPSEVNSIIDVCDAGKHQAELVVKEVVASGTDILSALHSIGSGEAFSKQADSMCLLTAIRKLCPYETARQCVGCPYEISTKSTFFLLIAEFNRMRKLYQTASNELERNKYQKLLKRVIGPKMGEMLTCIQQVYGDDTLQQYKAYLEEMITD